MPRLSTKGWTPNQEMKTTESRCFQIWRIDNICPSHLRSVPLPSTSMNSSQRNGASNIVIWWDHICHPSWHRQTVYSSTSNTTTFRMISTWKPKEILRKISMTQNGHKYSVNFRSIPKIRWTRSSNIIVSQFSILTNFFVNSTHRWGRFWDKSSRS